MATTTAWVVEQLWVKEQLAGQTDVVTTVAWRCYGTDGNYTGAVFDNTDITQDQGGGFIPYDQLTEAQVLDWVWANGVNKAAMEAAVAQQITEQLTPALITPGLPWQ